MSFGLERIGSLRNNLHVVRCRIESRLRVYVPPRRVSIDSWNVRNAILDSKVVGGNTIRQHEHDADSVHRPRSIELDNGMIKRLCCGGAATAADGVVRSDVLHLLGPLRTVVWSEGNNRLDLMIENDHPRTIIECDIKCAVQGQSIIEHFPVEPGPVHAIRTVNDEKQVSGNGFQARGNRRDNLGTIGAHNPLWP